MKWINIDLLYFLNMDGSNFIKNKNNLPFMFMGEKNNY